MNNSTESTEFKNNNKNEDLKESNERKDRRSIMEYRYSLLERYTDNNVKYSKSWDIYFTQNPKFEFSINGLNKLKQEIFLFYISMFCFDENEIKTKKNYVMGFNSVNDLNEIVYKSGKRECIKVFCQIFKKDELELITKKNEFLKIFKHYFIWSLLKYFKIGKIKNKYLKSKFFFESIQSVIDKLQEEGILFNRELEGVDEKKIIDENNIEKNEKIEILNDDKIPILYYELNELNNDEKNNGIIKEYKDENESYYQGAVLIRETSEESNSYSKSSKSSNSNSNSKSNDNSKSSNSNSKSNDNSKSNINNSMSKDDIKNNSHNNDESKSKDNNDSLIKINNNIKNSINSIKDKIKKHGLGREYHIKLINKKDKKDIRYKYIGYYKNNKFHCYGILMKENDECYYGEFRDGKKNGFGILFTKQYVYRGFFHDDKKNGYGEFFDKEKSINYCGNFVNDKYNGFGFYYKEKKFKYIGNFVDGYLKGLGLYIWNYEEKYYGNWSNDKMNGLGIYYYKGGDIFIGNYFNDKKNGNGKYIFTEKKSILEGEWKYGMKHGKYKFTCFKDGNLDSVDVRYVNNVEME